MHPAAGDSLTCLVVWQNARWCDAILPEQIIEPAILKVWKVFERHINRLARGSQPEKRMLTLASGGAIERLHTGKYEAARTQLIQIRNMHVLCEPYLAFEDETENDESSMLGAESAAKIKAVHDEVHEAADKCIDET